MKTLRVLDPCIVRLAAGGQDHVWGWGALGRVLRMQIGVKFCSIKHLY